MLCTPQNHCQYSSSLFLVLPFSNESQTVCNRSTHSWQDNPEKKFIARFLVKQNTTCAVLIGVIRLTVIMTTGTSDLLSLILAIWQFVYVFCSKTRQYYLSKGEPQDNCWLKAKSYIVWSFTSPHLNNKDSNKCGNNTSLIH